MAPAGGLVLDAVKQDIRIIHLLPGTKGSPLRCRVSRSELGNPEPYTALSYVWGDPALVSAISVMSIDGVESIIHVTKNLAEALQILRHESSEKAMWIDAICIDQKNDEEKTHQVRLMGRIFQQSRDVLVWLGVESDTSVRAMREIEALVQLNQELIDDWSKYDTWAIADLLCRPWFSRLWVRQEIYMAPPGACIVQCGDERWNIKVLRDFVPILKNDLFRSQPSVIIQRWHKAAFITQLAPITMITWFISSGEYQLKKYKLRWWLRALQSLQATDLRDHVFCSIAISEEAREFSALIDYSKDLIEVFASVVLAHIRKYRNLEILRVNYTQRPELNLPSWCPDWTMFYALNESAPFVLVWFNHYKACGDVQTEFKISSGMRVLTLEGIEVASVVKVGEAGQRGRQFLSQRQMFTSDPLSIDLYGPEYVDEAFWRTIITDMNGPCVAGVPNHGAPHARWPKDEGGKAFRDWIRDEPFESRQEPFLRGIDVSLDSFRIATRGLDFGCLMLSSRGHLGVVSTNVKVGDIICVLDGGNLPCVLREDEGGYYKWAGNAYVHGIMDGEAVAGNKAQRRSFSIV